MLGRRKKTQNETIAPEPAGPPPEAPPAKRLPEKKGVPTPTRREQEAARKRPLVANNRKEARKRQRQQVAEDRAKMRHAMETGEEKYLPTRDRGPQKRLARDYIDARTGIGEWLLVIVLVFLFASFLMTEQARTLVAFSLWAVMFAVIVECWWVARQVRRRIEEKFGVGQMEKGIRFYSAMRALQVRRLRLPKPMVRRGERIS
ncbi:MAG: DUF3043 domain-containing protein [Nesterenkonia sp.]